MDNVLALNTLPARHVQNQPPRRRLLVIVNGLSAHWRARRLEAALKALRARGAEVEERHTEAAGDPLHLAREVRDADVDAIVVAGGDGTINEVINGLLIPAKSVGGAMIAAGDLPPLAIIPLGTANVLAGEIGLDLDPGRVAEAIVHGPSRRICLGQARRAGGQGTRLFTLMAGAGFDAHVVQHVNPGLKARFKKGAYVLEMMRQLVGFPFPAYRVTVDGAAHDAASVVVANARYYGGRLVIAPGASLDEPSFEVVVFKRSGARNAVRYSLALGMDRLASLPDIEVLRGSEVAIEGPIGDPVQADGDIIARLPVTLAQLPDALEIVAPASA
jgi:YegS/Rv2252/BmrU family lipid kinase